MKPILLIPVLALAATNSQAALISSAQSNADPSHFNTASNWVGGATVNIDDDYQGLSGHVIRTPKVDNSTFNGKSLTILSGSTLATKNGSNTPSTIAIADLRLSGGSIAHFGNSDTLATFTGGITIVSSTTSTINISSISGRTFAFDSLVSGDGTLQFTGTNNTNNVSFNNPSNSFSGLFDIQKGVLNFNYDHATASSLKLSSQGKLLLDQNLSFSAVTINGDSLAIGSYTQDELVTANAAYAAFFSGSSTGNTITVIPEPSALLLGAIGALALLRKRR